MIIICTHKCDQRNFCLFLSTDSGRRFCSIADFGWLFIINCFIIGCIGVINLVGLEI